MQKSKLGITVGALGAITYFTGLFNGYLVAIIVAGYVLLFEDNTWLRRTVVKAVALMVFFSVLIIIINLIPDAVSFFETVSAVFNGELKLEVVHQIVNAITIVIDIVEKILFIGLGFKALNQSTIVIPFIDSLVSRYMD